jgi:hypothetical protein
MDQPIQERHGHLLEAYDLRPLGKSQVGSKSDAGARVSVTEELKEQLSRVLGKRQVAYLIDQHQVKAAILC